MGEDPLDTFQRELRGQLVAAARTQATAPVGVQRVPALAIRVAAVAAVAALLSIGFVLVRPSEALADVFEITRRDNEVILEVVDLVEDPDSIIQQLSSDLDLEARVEAVPVPDQMIGEIIAVGSLGSLEPTIEESADGTVSTIRLPVDGGGPLIFEYGREANVDEEYAATRPDPSCADFVGRTVSDARADLLDAAGTVQFESVNSDGSVTEELNINNVDPNAIVVQTFFTSSDTLFVDVSFGAIEFTPHPNCVP